MGKRMALFLKIDTTGCLEKSEFVERIAASDQVQIVDSTEPTEGSSSSSSMFDYATAPGHSDMAEVLKPLHVLLQTRMQVALGVARPLRSGFAASVQRTPVVDT